jgi:hypothetical protein
VRAYKGNEVLPIEQVQRQKLKRLGTIEDGVSA